MPSPRVTVLGGGNTAFAVAANLTLRGISVTLCEIAGFESMIAPIRESREIHLAGVAARGVAKVHRVTTDLGEALAFSDLTLLIVPAYAHKPFAEACGPHLRPGQTVVLMPGTLGALEFARILRERGCSGVTLAETDTAPYVCRKVGPDRAHIWGVVSGLGVGVFPAAQTGRVLDLLSPLFPGCTAYPHVAASGLGAMNPVVHPAGVLMNAGRIEYSRGEFYFYEEGVTPGVVSVIVKVDEERRAVGKALGLDLCPVDEGFYRAGFGPKGDLWATINGSRMLTQLRAPGSLESRWLTEDVPYGLAAWVSVGRQYGVEAPTMRALVDLGSVVMGFDAWAAARGVKALGIEGMSRERLLTYLREG
jgi:opine dehydrogenase